MILSLALGATAVLGGQAVEPKTGTMRMYVSCLVGFSAERNRSGGAAGVRTPYSDVFEADLPRDEAGYTAARGAMGAAILNYARESDPSFDWGTCGWVDSTARVDILHRNRASAGRTSGSVYQLDSGMAAVAMKALSALNKPKARRMTLDWRGNDGNSEGYHSASIDLAYTFLQCAGEIQIAYAIDRGSFKTSRNYYIPARGGRDAVITEIDSPPAPSAIHLKGTIWFNDHPRRVIGNLDDRFAGESLGMGCFDGQTRKLGTVAQLVGAGATPDKVNAFLSSLKLEVPMYLGGPLTRAGVAAGAATAAAAAARAKEAEEARKQDDAKVDAANAAALKATLEQSRAIDAQMAAGRKAKADYEAAMERHRRAVAEAQSQRRAYEARAATHRACVAGDAAACARYNAGQ